MLSNDDDGKENPVISYCTCCFAMGLMLVLVSNVFVCERFFVVIVVCDESHLMISLMMT